MRNIQLFNKEKVKKDRDDNMKSTIKSIIKKVPGDLIRKKIVLRQRHLNSLLRDLKLFKRAEIMVWKITLILMGNLVNRHLNLCLVKK
jgi:hypothetical protein